MFSQETSARIGANDGSDSSASCFRGSCFRGSFFRRRFKLFYKRYNNCVRNNVVQESNLRRYCDSGMQRSHNSSNDRRNLRRQWDMEIAQLQEKLWGIPANQLSLSNNVYNNNPSSRVIPLLLRMTLRMPILSRVLSISLIPSIARIRSRALPT